MNVPIQGISALIAALAALIPAVVVWVNLIRDTRQSTRKLEIGGRGPASAWPLTLTRELGGAAVPLRARRDNNVLRNLARRWNRVSIFYSVLILTLVFYWFFQVITQSWQPNSSFVDVPINALLSPIFFWIIGIAYLSYIVVALISLMNAHRIRGYIREQKKSVCHTAELQVSISPRSSDDQMLIMQCLVAVKVMGAEVQTWDSVSGLLTSDIDLDGRLDLQFSRSGDIITVRIESDGFHTVRLWVLPRWPRRNPADLNCRRATRLIELLVSDWYASARPEASH